MNTRRCGPLMIIRCPLMRSDCGRFNFEYINETLTGGATDRRITSYFSNSRWRCKRGCRRGVWLSLLTPFADALPLGAIDALNGAAHCPTDQPATARHPLAPWRALSDAEPFSAATAGTMLAAPTGQPLSFQHPAVQRQPSRKIFAIQSCISGLARLGIH